MSIKGPYVDSRVLAEAVRVVWCPRRCIPCPATLPYRGIPGRVSESGAGRRRPQAVRCGVTRVRVPLWGCSRPSGIVTATERTDRASAECKAHPSSPVLGEVWETQVEPCATRLLDVSWEIARAAAGRLCRKTRARRDERTARKRRTPRGVRVPTDRGEDWNMEEVLLETGLGSETGPCVVRSHQLVLGQRSRWELLCSRHGLGGRVNVPLISSVEDGG